MSSEQPAAHAMHKFLVGMGCRRRGTDYLIDEFNHEFYLRFDAAYDPETPDATGTVDIHVVPVGLTPTEGIRVATNCTRHKVMRFMFAIGVDQLKVESRQFLYQSNTILRAE